MSERSSGPKYDEKRKVWSQRVRVRRADGTVRHVRVSAPTKKACAEKVARLSVSVADRTYVERSNQRLADFLEEWLGTVDVKPGTRAIYRRNLTRHVVPRIGHLRLQALDPGVLNGLYAELVIAGLGPATIRNQIHAPLRKALSDAVGWGRLVRNPAKAANPPKAATMADARPEMATWTGPQVEAFLTAEAGSRYAPVWTFLVTTGCRRGEALGLRWNDLELDASPPHATIRQTVTSIDHAIHIAPSTKTGRGRRVDLDQRTVGVLRTHKAAQAEERLLMGAGYRDHGLVFALPDGRPYNPEYVSREFSRRVARTSVPRIRLHDLRHTWASLALAEGVDVKVVSERLGHSSTTITRDIYQHVTPAMASEAAEKVASVIFGGARSAHSVPKPTGH